MIDIKTMAFISAVYCSILPAYAQDYSDQDGSSVEQVSEKKVSEDAGKLYRRYLKTKNEDFLKKLNDLAVKEDADAIRYIGDIYFQRGDEDNLKLAIESYEKAAEFNDAASLFALGNIYKEDKVYKADLEKSAAYFMAAHKLGHVDSTREYSLIALTGKLNDVDPSVGIGMLVELAENGDVGSQYYLGNAYETSAQSTDMEKSIHYYGLAVNGGNEQAAIRLANIFGSKESAYYNDEKAKGYLEEAASLGSESAKVKILIETIRRAEDGLEADGAVNELKQIAQKGNKSAATLLGDLFSRNPIFIDYPAAVSYYKMAAEKRSGYALRRLGELSLDKRSGDVDSRLAIQYFSSAIEAGDRDSFRILALGHLNRKFGPASDPRSAEGILVRALAADSSYKNDAAAVALSNIYINGNPYTKRQTAKGINLLETYAEHGHYSAIKPLLSIHRVGRKEVINRDLRKAESYLGKYASKLSADQLELEETLLKAAAAGSLKDYQDVYDRAASMRSIDRLEFIKFVRATNPNVYTYLLQNSLKAAGYYDGKLNGLLGQTTINSFSKYCNSQNKRSICITGPLSSPATTILSELMVKG